MVRSNESFIQRTKDSYFNATILLNDFNTKSKNKPLQLASYKGNKGTKDFIRQLQKENIESPMISGRGINGGTWMHPKLFIDFAMWVSVEFKSVVIDYVLDGLIMSRHDAGDYYNEMCVTILSSYVEFFGCKPNPMLYINEARNIKKLLNLSKKERNLMTEKELNNITIMQKANSIYMNKGMGKVKRYKLLEMQAEILNI